jgi:hypothetical protein
MQKEQEPHQQRLRNHICAFTAEKLVQLRMRSG